MNLNVALESALISMFFVFFANIGGNPLIFSESDHKRAIFTIIRLQIMLLLSLISKP